MGERTIQACELTCDKCGRKELIYAADQAPERKRLGREESIFVTGIDPKQRVWQDLPWKRPVPEILLCPSCIGNLTNIRFDLWDEKDPS